jgi:PmbA/TldA metallopeptidase C-terminal domain
MGNMTRRICLPLIGCFLGSLSWARAQDDAVMRAMRDELDRSMKQTRLGNLDKPYFIAYRVIDLTNSAIAATLGSLTSNQQSHTRQLTVEVRVGGYRLDNSNFLSFSAFGRAGVVRGFGNTVRLPLEDDYKEIRRQIWLATDAAYKKALEDLARKRAALENKTRGEDLPDFSKEEPVTSHENPAAVDLDRKRAEALVRQLSAVFRGTPDISQSSVEIQASNAYTRYLNSEGTEYTRASPLVGLTALARTQASDGMPLSDALTVYERSMAALPSEQLEAQIRDMSKRLVELRSAPLVERYNGPVLFEGQASAEIFAQAFAPQLVATRRPVTDNPQFEMIFSRTESPFQDRMGSRVLPEWVSVTDDPTAKEQNGTPLLGGYSVDDDGVRARKTEVVEKGILKTLLLSRHPVRGMPQSTGNERGFGVAPTNLFLTVQNGLNETAIREKLLSLVKQRGKPYGIVVRRMRNPLVGDPQEMMELAMGAFTPGLGGGGKGPARTAVLAYEVFPDGHEQLIRNAQLEGVNEASFKDLVTGSASQTVCNRPFLDIGNMVTGMFSGGFLAGQGNPPVVSFAVPDLLFDDVSLNPPSGDISKPPLSEPPSGT